MANEQDLMIGLGHVVAYIPNGTSGQVLTANGAGIAPTYQAASASGAITTVTGNSGGAEVPLSGNFNVLGTGSITVAGSSNTETVQLTGLTNHAVLVGAGTATITKVGPTATVGQVLQSAGSSADPAFSTATYPLTTTSQQILYSTANNVVGELTTANSKLPATNSSGTLAMRAFSVVTQTFSASGTYTPTAGMLYCKVRMVGGGGAGGGAPATGAATYSSASGGGYGEYAEGTFSAATIGASQTVTIAAAATGVSGTTGNNGGTCSLGALITAFGGSGGISGPANTTVTNSPGGAGGTGGSGGSFRSKGQAGENSFATASPTLLRGGMGGSGQFGSGGTVSPSGGQNIGTAGAGYGAGGGGGSNFVSQTATTGGAGTAGIIVIDEYVIA